MMDDLPKVGQMSKLVTIPMMKNVHYLTLVATETILLLFCGFNLY